jgi:hypothetical protein
VVTVWLAHTTGAAHAELPVTNNIHVVYMHMHIRLTMNSIVKDSLKEEHP